MKNIQESHLQNDLPVLFMIFKVIKVNGNGGTFTNWNNSLLGSCKRERILVETLMKSTELSLIEAVVL